MAKIQLEKAHSKPLVQVKSAIDGMMERMKSMGVDAVWQGDTLQLSGKGVKGTVAVSTQNVAINLDLGLPASLMKGKIEAKIREGLERHLA